MFISGSEWGQLWLYVDTAEVPELTQVVKMVWALLTWSAMWDYLLCFLAACGCESQFQASGFGVRLASHRPQHSLGATVTENKQNALLPDVKETFLQKKGQTGYKLGTADNLNLFDAWSVGLLTGFFLQGRAPNGGGEVLVSA